MAGTIRLVTSQGLPLEVEVEGVTDSEFPYNIAPDGVQLLELTSSSQVQVGYAMATADESGFSPSGVAIFQFRRENALISEAGVPAVSSTTRARLFVDNRLTRTGLALASPGNPNTEMTILVLDVLGNILDQTTRLISEGGHQAMFADELFPQLPEDFTGSMEYSSEAPLFPISLKLTINQRGDPLLTTLPIADLTRDLQRGPLVFPQFGLGGGFLTRLLFINPDISQGSTGQIRFFRSGTGGELAVQLEGRFDTEFEVALPAGGAVEFRPDETAKVVDFEIDIANPAFFEIVVAEGDSVQLRPRFVGMDGNLVDGIDAGFSSLDPQVASVTAAGVVQAVEKGFSTLSISLGNQQFQGMITVVELTRGVEIGPTLGIVQDLAGSIYLSSPENHTILRLESVEGIPVRYSGTARVAGQLDGARLDALFNQPTFLALDQRNGDLYVSDSGNHSIRRIRAVGLVETVAGSGHAGSLDGPASQASFRNPQGLVLDGQGRLWVADGGNHTIRRIELSTGEVQTIAGMPGQPGDGDGTGDEARFANPSGLALDTRSGSPAQGGFSAVLVADTGNGLIRSVLEDGNVSTLSRKSLGFPLSRKSLLSGPPLSFEEPRDVAVDSKGTLFVAELGAGLTRIVLSDGGGSQIALQGLAPNGIFLPQNGRLLLSGDRAFAAQVSFGAPGISSVTPDVAAAPGGEEITIRGQNFSPDSLVVIGQQVVEDIRVDDTGTIVFRSPPLSLPGLQNLTIVCRGGSGQSAFVVSPVPIEELSPGEVSSVAGGAVFVGDGGPALATPLDAPTDLAFDPAGNLFIADSRHNRIRRLEVASGTISTIVGNGDGGFAGDGGLAAAASIYRPSAVAFDAVGNLFVADTFNGRVRRVAAASGVLTTVAGKDCNPLADPCAQVDFSLTTDALRRSTVACRNCDPNGDGGPATATPLRPQDVAIDPSGNLFIADSPLVRRVDLATGVITTVAGRVGGSEVPLGDGGPATEASIIPSGITFDSSGILYIADSANDRIRQVDLETGIITTIAGSGCSDCELGDGGPALEAVLLDPVDIGFDQRGRLYILERTNPGRIRRVDFQTGIIVSLSSEVDNLPLRFPEGFVVGPGGNLFVADTGNDLIRHVDPAQGTLSTVAGITPSTNLGIGDGGIAGAASILAARGLVLDATGNLYFTDLGHNRVRRVERTTGLVTTVVGGGPGLPDGESGSALQASLLSPGRIAFDSHGFLYIADSGNDRLLKADLSAGRVTTVTTGRLNFPLSLTLDSSDNLYIGDLGNPPPPVPGLPPIPDPFPGRIVRVDASSGERVIAVAQAANPRDMTFDSEGNLYYTVTSGANLPILSPNNQVRRLDAETGGITIVAGTRQPGNVVFAGDGGLATETPLFVSALALDSHGDLWIATLLHDRVRMIDMSTGIITTAVGNGFTGFQGDGGPGLDASLHSPQGLLFDQNGNLFIAELSRVRVFRAGLSLH